MSTSNSLSPTQSWVRRANLGLGLALGLLSLLALAVGGFPSERDPHGGAHALLLGALLLPLAAGFLLAARALRSRTPWAWLAQLLPLLGVGAILGVTGTPL